MPIELITDIFNFLDESNVEMPLKMGKHRGEACKILMALRLTCRRLGAVATRQLFRTFYISQSWGSWLNAHSIAANQELRQHLQVLILDGRDDDVASYKQKYTDAERSPKLRFLGFSLFPKLKVFKLGDTWMLRKNAQSTVEILSRRCGIRLTKMGSMITGFEEMARYDFRLVSFSYCLGLPITSLDLSSVKTLRLSSYWVWNFQLPLKNDIDNLKDLPNLEEFYMNQHFQHRSDDSRIIQSMASVLELLASGSNWPQLRHLDLRYLFAEVDHLKTFIAMHAAAGALKTLEIHGDLVCAHVTPEEKQKRIDLPNWIKNVICAPSGVVEMFKHVMGPPEEGHEAEFAPNRSHVCIDTDMEDTDTENLDAENPGTKGPDVEDPRH